MILLIRNKSALIHKMFIQCCINADYDDNVDNVTNDHVDYVNNIDNADNVDNDYTILWHC